MQQHARPALTLSDQGQASKIEMDFCEISHHRSAVSASHLTGLLLPAPHPGGVKAGLKTKQKGSDPAPDPCEVQSGSNNTGTAREVVGTQRAFLSPGQAPGATSRVLIHTAASPKRPTELTARRY